MHMHSCSCKSVCVSASNMIKHNQKCKIFVLLSILEEYSLQ